jgi:hypothetical protein
MIRLRCLAPTKISEFFLMENILYKIIKTKIIKKVKYNKKISEVHVHSIRT